MLVILCKLNLLQNQHVLSPLLVNAEEPDIPTKSISTRSCSISSNSSLAVEGNEQPYSCPLTTAWSSVTKALVTLIANVHNLVKRFLGDPGTAL